MWPPRGRPHNKVDTRQLGCKGHIPLFQQAANLAANLVEDLRKPHSIKLILGSSNLVFDQVCSRVFDKFVRVCDMLSTRFRLFLSKTWLRTCCINLVMSRLMQQVCWFVRVLDKWNVGKKPVYSQPTNLLKLDFRYVFYYSCLS